MSIASNSSGVRSAIVSENGLLGGRERTQMEDGEVLIEVRRLVLGIMTKHLAWAHLNITWLSVLPIPHLSATAASTKSTGQPGYFVIGLPHGVNPCGWRGTGCTRGRHTL